jgi:hypothetical protein|mmetsp:Transcript_7044/g.12640  ORF Transcript_7044/g.12640 Transcript_7044/m.12640 type:complete len:86 (-) Transcript_7044:1195-1452(-)
MMLPPIVHGLSDVLEAAGEADGTLRILEGPLAGTKDAPHANLADKNSGPTPVPGRKRVDFSRFKHFKAFRPQETFPLVEKVDIFS